MLTSRQAFKAGFLHRCIRDGLTLRDATEIVEKAASIADTLVGLPGKAVDLAGKTLDNVWPVAKTGLIGAAAAPPIIGAGLGYGLAKATDIDDTDVDEVKKREIIDELHRQTETLKRERAMRDYRAQRKRPSHIYM